ncbi:MAG: histidine kinase [Bacteroidetes bacterium]|nr:MAG: histidine kinase [Bacteroidota bacterium]
MKKKITIEDRKARIIGVPLVSILILFASHSDKFYAKDWASLSGHIWICTLATFSIWEANRAIFIQFRRLFSLNQTKKRIIGQALLSLIVTFFISITLDYIICPLFYPEKATMPFLMGFKQSLIPTVIITLIYESVYFFESWKENVKQTESLARENVQSQLDALKNQLDPHFLFNSLNTLAFLIEEENNPAQEYLERLSDVYRYVLVNRNKNTVSLEEEMNFLESYIFLNKTRFRENLQIENLVPKNMYQQQIAPLSLQMLVENAIKHNVVSKEKPLKIKITQENEQYVSVENNIQQKTIFEKSTKVGLQNIINRYGLLTKQEVEIIKNTDFFKVRIPLIFS